MISCFFVPPDSGYADYFDLRTLVSLFCMMIVVSAMRHIGLFRFLAQKIVRVFRTTRSAITALVFVTYAASMLIANDMALITFLPLGYFVLTATGKEKHMAFTFIMQTIAANLGGMLTPFGNPQNLYIYNYFNIPTGEFFGIMWPPTLISVALIAVCCLFVKSEPLDRSDKKNVTTDKKRTAVYLVMFVYAIIIVFRAVPYWTGLVMVPILLFLDRKALVDVDYGLLLTFCMFFVFSGNMARIPAVDSFFRNLLAQNTLLTGVLSCQIISNVPSAILLSGFTTDYAALLMAVNIGGCGTLISSMASLISYKHFAIYRPAEVKKYLLMAHGLNFGFLALLTGACLLLA
ncbi:MAG TPA: anion permease [Firmicutes bacterium]|nr:anion permease [Bacillota bacterium]